MTSEYIDLGTIESADKDDVGITMDGISFTAKRSRLTGAQLAALDAARNAILPRRMRESAGSLTQPA